MPLFHYLSVAFFLLVTWPGHLSAHGDIHQQIAMLNRQLAKTETADLLLKRARLWREDGNLPAAMQDIESALVLDPNHGDALFWGAKTALDQQHLPKADALATRFFTQVKLQQNAGTLSRAHRLLADIHRAANEPERAIHHWQQYLALQSSPDPDSWLELAELLLQQQGFNAARLILQQALRKSAGNTVIQQRLVEMAISARAYPIALEMLDQQLLKAAAIRKVNLLLQKMEVLNLQGDTEQAQRVHRLAKAAFAQLPANRRNLPAVRQLQQQLQ